MLRKEELKKIASLQHKKFRRTEKMFFVEGVRLVEEALNSQYVPEYLLSTEKASFKYRQLLNTATAKGIRTEIISEKEFVKLSDTDNPQGIAVVLHSIINLKKTQPVSKNIIYLDQISDPGNLGTIIRSAAWFGFTDIVLSPDTADIENSKVIRSSMGAIFQVQFFREETRLEIIKSLREKNYTILVTDVNGSDLTSSNTPAKFILCFSSEAHGCSEDLKNISDYQLKISRNGIGESLNVASAAAIFMFALQSKTNG